MCFGILQMLQMSVYTNDVTLHFVRMFEYPVSYIEGHGSNIDFLIRM